MANIKTVFLGKKGKCRGCIRPKVINKEGESGNEGSSFLVSKKIKTFKTPKAETFLLAKDPKGSRTWGFKQRVIIGFHF